MKGLINDDHVQGGEALPGQHGVPRGGSHHQEGVDVSHSTKNRFNCLFKVKEKKCQRNIFSSICLWPLCLSGYSHS
jgi:hypothetical protein